jgi:hypothetical protein
MSKAQINIHTAVAGKRLKEDLFEIANRNFSMKLNSYLVSVLEAAVSDKGGYSSTIAYPREKGGSHIAIVLGDSLKSQISEWAKDQGSSLSLWTNHLLEKHLELIN